MFLVNGKWRNRVAEAIFASFCKPRGILPLFIGGMYVKRFFLTRRPLIDYSVFLGSESLKIQEL